jgi:hypothetical protein
MPDWIVHDGQLMLTGGGSAPSADAIYRSIVEGEQCWPDVAPGRSGDAAKLRFSPYPALARLLLHGSGGRPRLDFELAFPDGRVVAAQRAALRAGHLIIQGTWFPIEAESAASVLKLATDAGAPEGGSIPSLREVLVLRKPGLQPLVRDQLRLDEISFARDTAPAGPAGLDKVVLYPYQTDGWRWLRVVSAEGIGGLLADEMGLGKTLQVISLLCDPGERAVTPALIVAPGSLLENWCRELARFAPGLTVLKHHGPHRTGRPAALDGVQVVVTSYDTVVRDSALLEMREWSLVVLDEAQNIRNPAAVRTRSVKRLHRRAGLAVTGTPLENRLRDVWSLMDFVWPGYLGSEAQFERRYADSPELADIL